MERKTREEIGGVNEEEEERWRWKTGDHTRDCNKRGKSRAEESSVWMADFFIISM